MIKTSKILTLAELKEELQDKEQVGKIPETLEYIKKFLKLSIDKVKELRKALKDLDIMKLKERHIVKIIDLLPADADDLKKVFVGEDLSLDQNETEKILSIIKKYK